MIQDHLGSPRVITDQNGTVTSRKDFTAFGEENYSTQRTESLGYIGSSNPDDPRQGYTGYEKDSESGLDFAEARYYSSTHGRYTSVDPLTASATIRNPQTFNRYSYVLNSPYKFTDPLGLFALRQSSPEPAAYGCSAEFSSCGDDGWGTLDGGPAEESNTHQAETPATQETEQEHGGDHQQAQEPNSPPPADDNPDITVGTGQDRNGEGMSETGICAGDWQGAFKQWAASLPDPIADASVQYSIEPVQTVGENGVTQTS